MLDKAFDISTKILLGEEVSDEEKLYLKNRNTKYELVRYLVIEHSKYNGGHELKDFHFSPGDGFDDKSVLEIASTIVNIDLSNAKPLKFNDKKTRTVFDGPPEYTPS